MAQEDELLHVSFNRERTYFACASDSGAQVFKCGSIQTVLQFRGEKETGVGIVELEGSNRLYMVGGGEFPCKPLDTAFVWSEAEKLLTVKECPGPVKAIRVCEDTVAMITETRVILFSTLNNSCVCAISTVENPLGVSALSKGYLLAVPGSTKPGSLAIYAYRKKSFVIEAHNSPLACVGLSKDATLVASASTKGTLIRIFSTSTQKKLQELRRGKDSATIHSVEFSPDNRWLVVASSTQTLHVFNLNIDGSSSGLSASSDGSFILVSNPVSSLSRISHLLPKYFSSEWSFAQFRLPIKTKAIAVFCEQRDNTILVACYNGSFYTLKFNPRSGGEMEMVSYYKF